MLHRGAVLAQRNAGRGPRQCRRARRVPGVIDGHALLELDGVTAGYGGGDVLHDLDAHHRGGRDHLRRRSQRRGQVHHPAARQRTDQAAPRRAAFSRESIAGLSPRQILQLGIVQVPQERSLFPTMTVWENVRMGAYTLSDRALIERRMAQRMRDVPDRCGAPPRACRLALRRSAEDRRVRAGAHARSEAARARRTVDGPRPEDAHGGVRPDPRA